MKNLPIVAFTSLLVIATSQADELSPVISEFMASNDDTLVLADGTSPDWIEIHNPSDASISLAGWHLTDDQGILTRWTFPAGVTLAPDAYLLVYASGSDLVNPAADLHTNFKLTQSGEYLALVNSAGEVHQEFEPNYPEQYQDISFGFPSGETIPAYFTTPTPGQSNNEAILGLVEDTKFTVDRGFFDAPFEVSVTTATPGASIYYTTDGSDPTLLSPHVDAPDELTSPTLTLTISENTALRTFASKPNHAASDIDTQTYLFLDQVIADPAMSTTITNHAVWGPQMRDALLEIPSISLITQEAISDVDVNDPANGVQSPPEIPVSIEMIFPDGRKGFHVNAGIERFGGKFTVFPKQALRVSFKSIYGPKKLKFDLFGDTPYGGDSAVDSFDQILLRNGSQDSIFNHSYSHSRGVYIRNRYFFDRQLEEENLSMRGKFVHVYLNGVYNGQYHLMERPNADFMATHLGGEEEDYDIMKGRSGIFVSQGEGTAWDYLNANKNNYEIVEDYMDFNSYIDYMLLNFYGGNEHDWYPQHNWVAGRRREPGGKFKFFMWDNDYLNRRGGNATTGSTANTTDNGGPGNLLDSLVQHSEFKIRLADRAQKHFFNGGMLTPARVKADFTELAQSVSRTIIPEAARWSAEAREYLQTKAVPSPQPGYNVFFTPDNFDTYINWIVNVNAETRSDIVIGQMRGDGMFPSIDAPSFGQHGGAVPSGYPLEVNHTEGSLYYTTDGSDPRLPGGVLSPNAISLGGPNIDSVIIPKGSSWKLDDSGTDHGSSWQVASFDDSTWNEVPAPMGFGTINATSLETTVFSGLQKQVTFYCRKTFEIADASSIVAASMNLLADDGIIIYLNGQEIHRDNLPTGVINFSTIANANGEENEYENFAFDPSLLVQGTNHLSVEIHNRGAANSDIGFDFELVGELLDPNRFVTLNETSVVKARVLNETEWSALTEATFITDLPANSSNLVISEIHYHPGVDQNDDAEFIELMNISDQRINLSGVKFSAGITFEFGDQASLDPNERVILIYNQTAFEAIYGTEIPIGGIYTSRLSDGGERITLNAADGSIIETVDYSDTEPWPTIADGIGYSLVRVAPRGGGNPESPENWRSSISPTGTPSTSDSIEFTGDSAEGLLEYATGSNGGGLIEFIGSDAIFEYRRILGADDATVEVQVSTDLENWNSEGITFLSQSNMPNSTATMRWLLPSGGGNPVFARVHVVLNQ